MRDTEDVVVVVRQISNQRKALHIIEFWNRNTGLYSQFNGMQRAHKFETPHPVQPYPPIYTIAIVGRISLRTTCICTQLRFLRHNMHHISNKPLVDVA